ncbi:MAG: AAA family ATPase [Planctomycetota bacterium]
MKIMKRVLDEVFFIPRVNTIKIKNYGIIQDATIKFKKGLNIITGKGGSGKTTVINFLLDKFLPVNYLAHGDSIMMQIDSILNDKTIMIDDVLGFLNREQLNKTLIKLSNSGKQIILTLSIGGLSVVNSKIKINIIDTKDFKLRLSKKSPSS